MFLALLCPQKVIKSIDCEGILSFLVFRAAFTAFFIQLSLKLVSLTTSADLVIIEETISAEIAFIDTKSIAVLLLC